jgi:hypothetical protein
VAHLAHLSHSVALPKLPTFNQGKIIKRERIKECIVHTQGNQCAKCVKCATSLDVRSLLPRQESRANTTGSFRHREICFRRMSVQADPSHNKESQSLMTRLEARCRNRRIP